MQEDNFIQHFKLFLKVKCYGINLVYYWKWKSWYLYLSWEVQQCSAHLEVSDIFKWKINSSWLWEESMNLGIVTYFENHIHNYFYILLFCNSHSFFLLLLLLLESQKIPCFPPQVLYELPNFYCLIKKRGLWILL